MKRKLLTSITIGATAAMLAQGPAVAAGQGPVGTWCQAEIAKYCADVAHGVGAVPACLAKYKAELSPVCQRALANKGPGGGLGQGGQRGARWRN